MCDTSSNLSTPVDPNSHADTNFQVSLNETSQDTKRLGLLEIEIDLSNPEPTAGSSFTVYVIVTNPFDRPIWIARPKVFLPSELIALEEQRGQGSLGLVQELLYKAEQGKANIAFRDSLKNFMVEDLKSFLGGEASFEGILKKLARKALRVSERIEDLESELRELRIKVRNEIDGRDFQEIIQLQQTRSEYTLLKEKELEYIKYLDDCNEYLSSLTQQIGSLTGCLIIKSESNMKIEDLKIGKYQSLYVHASGNLHITEPEVVSTQVLDGSLEPDEPLQPGNKAVYTLMLKTKDELFFKPMQYIIRYSVNFSMHPPGHSSSKNSQCTNTISQKLVIRSPLKSVMFGAASGGFIGTAVRILQTFNPETFVFSAQQFVTAAISIILSAMAVVFLARKSDTQSLVSIEDFWGGLVIGFLVGYAGISFFESLSGITSESAPKIESLLQ
jgi:hypothetical protein